MFTFLAEATATNPTADIINVFLGYVLDIFISIGILLGVWAAGQLALAFKNEDADSKSRAMMMLVVAAILIGISPIATAIIPDGSRIHPGAGFLGLPGRG